MTRTWVLSNFEQDSDGVVVYSGEVDDAFCSYSVNPDWLASLGPTSDSPTYAELSKLPIAQQGWTKIFDQWRDRGILR